MTSRKDKTLSSLLFALADKPQGRKSYRWPVYRLQSTSCHLFY